MDNEKNPQFPENGEWLDELLQPQELPGELGPDEHALNTAEFANMEDIEVEKIMAQARSSDWDSMLEAMPDILPEEDAPSGLFDFSQPETDPICSDGFVPEQESQPQPENANASAESLYSMGDETLMRWASASADFQSGETRRYDKDTDWLLPEEPEDPEPEKPLTRSVPDPAGEPEEPEKPERQAPKRRPRAKKNYGLFGLPHLLSSVIWLGIIVCLGVTLGRTLWVCAADVLAFGKADISVTITITDADMAAENTMERVAQKLKDAGLISYPDLFVVYADLTDAQEEITAGTYTLRGTYDYMALVDHMTTSSSARETVEVMIPEGYTCAQIFQLLEDNGVCTVEELEEYASNGELKDYWFLEGVERGSKYCLEGFLFPDTYEFYVNDDAGRVLSKMLGDNVGGFDVRFTDIMQEKLVALNERLSAQMKKNGCSQEYIDSHQLTVRDVVIIASMIEKETTGSDRYDISSVIFNRLADPADYPYLNIDATIIYALGGKIDPDTGESIPLTEADMKLDSPYNTYLYKGLTPGPISNPGTYSLLAALDPNETDYYYYVYNPAIGAHKFSETYKEHLNYINSMG